jgi:hypothetical protein
MSFSTVRFKVLTVVLPKTQVFSDVCAVDL